MKQIDLPVKESMGKLRIAKGVAKKHEHRKKRMLVKGFLNQVKGDKNGLQN